MNRQIFLPGLVVLIWLAASATVMAQGDTSSPTIYEINVAMVLAPLAAAALGIERLLETLWGILETILRMLMIEASGPKYVEFKTWISAGVGLFMGIVIASVADLRMFGMLNLSANVNADVFITGLVIGSGSKFTHDLIGIFHEGKRALEQWRKLRMPQSEI